jgi:hypothetical protein
VGRTLNAIEGFQLVIVLLLALGVPVLTFASDWSGRTSGEAGDDRVNDRGVFVLGYPCTPLLHRMSLLLALQAADHILICDGRFRAEADMPRPWAECRPDATDPGCVKTRCWI